MSIDPIDAYCRSAIRACELLSTIKSDWTKHLSEMVEAFGIEDEHQRHALFSKHRWRVDVLCTAHAEQLRTQCQKLEHDYASLACELPLALKLVSVATYQERCKKLTDVKNADWRSGHPYNGRSSLTEAEAFSDVGTRIVVCCNTVVDWFDNWGEHEFPITSATITELVAASKREWYMLDKASDALSRAVNDGTIQAFSAVDEASNASASEIDIWFETKVESTVEVEWVNKRQIAKLFLRTTPEGDVHPNPDRLSKTLQGKNKGKWKCKNTTTAENGERLFDRAEVEELIKEHLPSWKKC